MNARLLMITIALVLPLSGTGCRSVGVSADHHPANGTFTSSTTQKSIERALASSSVRQVACHQTDSFKSLIESETSLLNDPTRVLQASDPQASDFQANDVPIDVVETSMAAGISLVDLEAMALGAHPAIVEARARMASTRGQVIQSGLSPNPVVQYQSDEVGNERSSGLHRVTISQQFITAGKLNLAQQVQSHEFNRRKAQLQRAELQVLTQVRSLFNRCLIDQQRSELTQRIVELSDQSIDSVQALLRAEEVSKISLLQAKVENEQAQIANSNARIGYEASLRGLSAAIGNGVVIDQRLVGTLESELADRPWSATLSEIVAASPELSAANSSLQRARWALQLACANVTPNVTASVGVGLDAFTEDTFATVGVSVPLPLRNRNQGNILSARANITSATAAIDRTRLDLESRLAEAAGRYQTAKNRHTRLKERVIPTAEETYELSQKAFEAGETGYIQLLTAQRTLFSTRLDVLSALSQAKQAAAEIEGLLVTLEN